ncbi:MAG: hypothetical protein I3273_02670 [Candidatus Moeniiplasma glomeromycotorum]|nr:hypothetical protein [Candidatus Moeniiplasma glomeromycotorum]MCE8167640.1 hypothetical protein [Candidatus Moeniiplasma glomeromycotorum]MCE8169009.1 hypothetical protein [Candidatus Moeniiplasma glomeromycotorum]
MADPLTSAAIGSAIVKALKEVGQWAWGYAKKTLAQFWENKWILLIAGVCSGIFVYYYNMLNSWFGFPLLLNIGILGIFALMNISWVVSYWKPLSEGGSGGGGVKVSTGD